MAKVSIVLTSYNYENYIKESIESVINQTFSDWEMIIVDDGSKDNSVSVIQNYCQNDSRIKLYQHENGINKGVAESLKLGISLSHSEWLLFLESDDTIEPDYIEKKLNIAKQYPDVSIIFNDINMFGDKTVIDSYEKYFKKQRRIVGKIKYPSKMLKAYRSTHSNLIPTISCVMTKNHVFDNIDFNSPIKNALDMHLYLQMLNDNVFYYLPEKLTNWRMHKASYNNQKITSKEDEFNFYKERIEILYGKKSLQLKMFLIHNFIKKIKLKISGRDKR